MKKVKTITIIDNNDGINSQYVHISNIEGRGTELEANRAMVNIKRASYPNDSPYENSFKINIEIDCLPDNNRIAYNIFKNDSMDDISNKDLIKELKSRNLLSEEIVYKINE